MSWYENPEWLTALGTVGAVFVAIFGVGIYEYIIKPYVFGIRPKLKITIEPNNHVDFHKTSLTMTYTAYLTNGQSFPRAAKIDAYILRFCVKNDGKYFIEDAEVMIEKLRRLNNDAYEEVKGFVPLNLQWSNYERGKTTMPKIQPDMFKHCDFLNLVSPSEWNRVNPDQKCNASFKVAGDLQTVVKPNMLSFLEPGEYEAIIKFAGNNVKSQTILYRFSLKDDWTLNENDMQKNISIEPANNNSAGYEKEYEIIPYFPVINTYNKIILRRQFKGKNRNPN